MPNDDPFAALHGESTQLAATSARLSRATEALEAIAAGSSTGPRPGASGDARGWAVADGLESTLDRAQLATQRHLQLAAELSELNVRIAEAERQAAARRRTTLLALAFTLVLVLVVVVIAGG